MKLQVRSILELPQLDGVKKRLERKMSEVVRKREQIETIEINFYQLHKLTEQDTWLRNLNYGMHAWNSEFRKNKEYFPNYLGLIGIDGPITKRDVIRYYAERGDPLSKALNDLYPIIEVEDVSPGVRESVLRITEFSDTVDRINHRSLTSKEYLHRLGEANKILKKNKLI